ncbi:PREDICTED: uncharacterized protein LOC109234488 isoform X1 [Nicotiana attenuata]|uniref:WLM domain-containing protein n=1 Tax=Nicotiana attenuata TaxID=49451 RepID=A0A1J6HY15_NICAT|nr:PREDICTED: uncharacterized protein LOC109234488 isoform X1 [Nicotiana attenuata]OIS97187.1 hypothetical protein A4A49_21330 [Nicotiana attenuata]
MQQQETCHLSVIWRGKKFSLEMDPTATLKSLGDELLNLTNVRDDTLRLIVPTSKSSRLLYPFSEEHSCLKLEAASILEGKSIRMLGVPKDEVDDILQSAKADLRIVGFDEEEERLKQRISNGLQSSLKLPQGPYVFCDFRTLHLPGVELNPPASKALKLMHKLAADLGIVAIMNKHRWRVGIMTEMAPEGYVGVSPKCMLGFNKNHGEEISLRLRTDDLKGFRKYDSIKKTLLHELAHMVHSEHDANFYALDKQLNEEAAKLDWTKSRGHTLSGGSLQHYEEDEDNDNHTGLSHRLGGQSSIFNARASSVAAAYSRLAQASTNHSEAIDMDQESNSGDSLDIRPQSNHTDALLEKQLNDPKVETLGKCNGVSSANVSSDDQRKSEPDPDDYEAGCPMKHEPSTELDSDDHKMRNLPPLLGAKLREEPDPDDCSSEKHAGRPISLEPDPDKHAMGIEKKVMSGQNSRVPVGYHVNEEESGSFSHTNRDDFPEQIKHVEPYTNDNDIMSDGISSTLIDEPDPDDQELQRIQDPVAIVCSRLQKAIGVLRSQANPLEASRVVQTIVKIIRNVIEHPDEVKFRKLRKANPLIQRDVVSYPAAMDILSVIGFSEDAVIDNTGRMETYLVLKRNDPGLLWLAKSSLETSIA